MLKVFQYKNPGPLERIESGKPQLIPANGRVSAEINTFDLINNTLNKNEEGENHMSGFCRVNPKTATNENVSNMMSTFLIGP